MRLLRRGRTGRLQHAPLPLELCPGLPTWEAQHSREYLVFVDESFFEFFGFANDEGDFCHGAVGVPKDKYDSLVSSMAPAIEAYHSARAQTDVGKRRELKFKKFKGLSQEFRLAFHRELAKQLKSVGGFVAAFYTTTRGIGMERVRVNLMDDHDSVPADSASLYDEAKAELLAGFKGPGQSGLMQRLIFLPMTATSNLLSSFNCTFSVVYDPRGAVEDREVKEKISKYMENLRKSPEYSAHFGALRGINIEISSHEEVGLQLADIIAGEVRSFFRKNRMTLKVKSSLRLVTMTSREPMECILRLGDSWVKMGALSRMPLSVARLVTVPNDDNPISLYYPILASGILACITETGQPRLLEFPTQLILDQLE